MRKCNFYFTTIFTIFGCSRYPADVERVLKFVGDNRAELEKVLNHYSHNPEDSLQLKAAQFLVAITTKTGRMYMTMI